MMNDLTSKVVLKKIAKNKRAHTTMSYGQKDDVLHIQLLSRPHVFENRRVSDATTQIAHVLSGTAG